jgi:para-nitrobenzyl esterase
MKRLLFSLAIAASLANAALQEPIRVDGGLITGTPAWGWGVRLYRGIPYAAPPVGKLRWRPPQPIVPWKGVLAADHFSAACVQLPRDQNNIGWRDGMVPVSEDCLYINVWTPAKSVQDKLPVMVWIHGGGFREGSGAETAWAGDNLAKKGVIYVNFNYRLNVFGFLAHPDLTRESEHHSSGNYAFLDQVAALRWVQKNIAQFGGDPDNVTIFGQSAGGASVGVQMVSPLSKGLFKRAVGQSGGVNRGIPLAEAEKMGVKFAESLGAHSIAELRAKPASEVVKAQTGMPSAVVDGWVLPEDPVSIFQHGRQNDVPLICGSTADDGPGPGPPKKAAEVPAYAKANFGDLADEYMKVFPATTDALAKKAEHDVRRDRSLYGARLWVNLAAATGHNKVFWYLFSHPAPVPPDSHYDGKAPSEVGAYHGVDNNYIFDNLRAKDWPWTDVDQKLAKIVSGMWVQFVKTGDPNGPGLPNWEPYNPRNPMLLNITATPKMALEPYKTETDFFEKAAARGRRGAS